MKLLNRRLKLIVPAILISQIAIADDKIEIDDAWLAEAPPTSSVMAAYLKIENETGQDRQAVSMQCKEFDRAEFHRTVEKDGMARMEHQQVLNIPADSELELEPGGYHIMLFNPARHFVAGDKTSCGMKFDDGTNIAIELKVKKSSAENHSHHH
jgi:copper(I)-binding protein